MDCSKCGAGNAAGSRFCNQCGTPLNKRCPTCNFENDPEARFCSQCATSLAAGSLPPAPAVWGRISSPSSTIEGERKTVTALFADIKGSMELMEDLDPEEARAIVDPALKLMIDAVHRYDGYGAPRRRGKEAPMAT